MPGSGGGGGGGTCVLSPRENAPMASLSLGSGFIFIHPIISVG